MRHPCPNFQGNSFTSFGVQRYFHLYWIPTIPTRKHVGVECSNCKHTLTDDEIPSHMIDEIKSSVFSTGATLPMYSGLVIIAALVGFIFYSIEQDEIQAAAYVELPAVSDYYVVNYTKIFEDADAVW